MSKGGGVKSKKSISSTFPYHFRVTTSSHLNKIKKTGDVRLVHKEFLLHRCNTYQRLLKIPISWYNLQIPIQFRI